MKPYPHGTNSGYVRGCRCDPCRHASRVYNAQRRAAFTQQSREQHKDTEAPTPIQSCNCSLAGWDPPWMWTWVTDRPISEMRQIPTCADYAGSRDRDWMDRMTRKKEEGR